MIYTISKVQIEQLLSTARDVDWHLGDLGHGVHHGLEDAITMLQSLLQQGEAQPVASWQIEPDGHEGFHEIDGRLKFLRIGDLVYTHPPAPKLVMLTLDELDDKLPAEWNLVELCASVQQAFCTKNGLTLEASK